MYSVPAEAFLYSDRVTDKDMDFELLHSFNNNYELLRYITNL